MDVQIEEMTSRVDVTDSHALLDHRILERIVEHVTKRVRDNHDREKRAREDSKLRPGASAEPAENWD